MKQANDTEFLVEDVKVLPLENIILRENEEIKVSSRAVQLLQYLIQHSGTIVTYHEANEALWNGGCTENSFYQQIATLRKSLGDNSHKPRIIQTVAKQGYKFIGSSDLLERQKKIHELNNSPTKQTKPYWRILSIAIVCTIITIISVIAYIQYSSTNNNHYAIFYPLVNELRDPETVIIIERIEKNYSSEHQALANALIQLTQHHLTNEPNQHAAIIPKYLRKPPTNKSQEEYTFYRQLSEHYSGQREIGYIFRPTVTLQENTYSFNLHVVDRESHQVNTLFTSTGKREEFTQALKLYELKLIESFSNLSLTTDPLPVLNDSKDATSWFIETVKSLHKTTKSRADIEESIRNAQKTINLNPNNLVAYSIFWQETLHLISIYSDFDLSSILAKVNSTTNKALRLDKNFHRAKFVQADKFCWIGEYEKCQSGMSKVIGQYPFDPHIIDSLYWNIIDNPSKQLAVAKQNYSLNPFYPNSFPNYRDALLQIGDFHTLSELVEYHSKWSDPKDWFVQAQGPTSIEILQQQATYYRDTYLNITPHNMLDSERLPSKYIGYSLLNSNQPELAHFWAKNGMERDLPYFDLKVIPLLANLWTGDWKPLDWQITRAYAIDRNKVQNALDKLTIAYFDFYTGWISQSAEMFLQLYPELEARKPVINNGNIRVFIYYSEIQKRLENFKYVNRVNPLIKAYLAERINDGRGVDIGISDVEFYAMNNEKEKALTLLEKAIHEQNWLPNSLWLWPPLEHNLFLKSIHTEPKYQRLVNHINQQLDTLCFKEDCAQSLTPPP